MGSSALMILAVALLATSLLLAYLGRRSKPIAVTLGALVLGFVVLGAMFFAADRFTGHGIDQAVLYHVAYGLGGAGFSEYAPLMLGVVALVIIGLAAAVACTLLLTRTRPRPRVLPTSRASVLIALLACAFNPASRDLVQLAGGASLPFDWGDSGQHESFKQYYRAPKLGSNPQPLRNFIYIYAEGLERTYFDEKLFPGLIVSLREVEAMATSFTNIGQLNGTSFTIGGIVGSQCGIPLQASSGGNSMAGMSRYLPNAVCIGDLLRARGYRLSYMGGASLNFAGKGKFLSGHGFQDVQGREELSKKLPDPDYQSGWGLHDDSLLDMAFDKLGELSASNKPFGLFMLTLDTHHPNGHVSKATANIKYENGKVPILNAVAGSDRLLSSFIQRVRQSPAGKDTLIILASDHLALQNGAAERLARGERRNMFMLIDPRQPGGVTIDKPGNTLDVAPTVLHALGYRASVGLGRDLLSEERSLVEELPSYKQALASWKEPLAGFWGFSRLEDMQIDAAEKTIEVGGATASAPALITFDEQMAVDVFFEFYTRQSKLTDRLYKLPMGKPFVWVSDCERALGYADLDAETEDRGLCVISGRRGAPPVLSQRTGSSMEIDEDQFRSVLDTQANPETYAEQTRRLAVAQLPSGLVQLTEALPAGSTFFYAGADRTAAYIKDYSAHPSVAAKGITWTTALPSGPEFYFSGPAQGAVKKSRRYAVRRLAFGEDIVSLLQRYRENTVILSVRGDMKALSPRTIDYFARLGIDLTKHDPYGSFAAVLDKGVVVAQGMANDAPVTLSSPALLERGINGVESAGAKLGNFSRIMLGGKDVSPNRRGLNVTVLSGNRAREAFTFDTHQSERLPSDVYKAVAKN